MFLPVAQRWRQDSTKYMPGLFGLSQNRMQTSYDVTPGTAGYGYLSRQNVGWNPSEGGVFGKIASRIPYVAPYFAGQAVFKAGRNLYDTMAPPGTQPGFDPATLDNPPAA